MRSLDILVVDDEPNNVEILQTLLGAHGHRVTQTWSGQQALMLCIDQKRPFDLVIMDVAMPTLDGLEVVRRLRAHVPTRGLPIVCLSARATAEDQRAGKAAGCDRYVLKPFHVQELMEAVTEVWKERGGERSPDETAT